MLKSGAPLKYISPQSERNFKFWPRKSNYVCGIQPKLYPCENVENIGKTCNVQCVPQTIDKGSRTQKEKEMGADTEQVPRLPPAGRKVNQGVPQQVCVCCLNIKHTARLST